MRIAIFYVALFGTVGILLPYLPPYLRALGFDGKQIATIGSLSPLLMILVPPIWGFLADRTRRPVLLLALACFGGLLAFAPMLWARSFLGVVAAMALYGLFHAPQSALADTVAVSEARRLGTDYARLRLWGSVGFVLTSFGFSAWLTRGGDSGDVVPAILVGLGVTALAATGLRSAPGPLAVPRLGDAGRLAARPAFLLFLLAGLVHWAALGPFHILYAIHLEDVGVSPAWIGAGLAGAVIAEVVVMALFRGISRRVSLFPLLTAAFVVSAGRWAATAWLDDGAALALVQIAHGLTFGAFFAGSIAFIEVEAPASLLATGRGLYSALVFGVGGVTGNLLAGALYDAGGGDLAFLTAAGLDLFAPLVLVLAVRARSRAPAPGVQ